MIWLQKAIEGDEPEEKSNQGVIEQLVWYFEADDGLGADTTTKEAFKIAIKALQKLDCIDAIIHNTQGIQEDVIRYKMICEVMEND